MEEERASLAPCKEMPEKSLHHGIKSFVYGKSVYIKRVDVKGVH